MGNLCPNHKDRQFKKIEEALNSKVPAYSQWRANDHVIPDFGPFFKYEDVISYLLEQPNLIKKSSYGYTLIEGSKASPLLEENERRASSLAGKINRIYGEGTLSRTNIPKKASISALGSGATYVSVIKVNEANLRNYWKRYQEVDRDYKENQESGGFYETPDKEIVPKADEYLYQSRVSGLSREEYKRYKRKKAIFSRIFPEIKVIEDYDLDIPGQIEVDGNTIRINPRLMTRDTLGHEFGHILIDSLGGMSNPLVRKGRDQLVGSKVEKIVYDKYKELIGVDQERLDKEVLAYAIGVASDKLFSSKEEAENWNKWLKRFFDKITSLLGIKEDAIIELTSILFTEDTQENVTENIRSKVDTYNEESDPKSQFYKLKGAIIETLKQKAAIYGKSDNKDKVRKIEELRDIIENEIKDPIKAIIEFQKFATEQTDFIYNRLLRGRESRAKGVKMPFTAKELTTWRDYVEGFSILDELSSIVFNYTKDANIRAVLHKEIDLEKLTATVQKKKEIIKAYEEEGIKVVSEFLYEHSGHIKAHYRELFRKGYYKLTEAEKANTTPDQYADEMLEKNSIDIETLTKANIERELKKASGDINYASRWVDNVMDSNDVIVSSMAKATVKALENVRRRSISLRNEYLEEVRHLEKHLSSKLGINKSQRDLYSFMIEQDSEGNYTEYLVDAYTPDFWDAYRSYRESLKNEGFTESQVMTLVYRWKDEHAPMSESNKEDYYKERGNFIDSLLETGKIDEKEHVDIVAYFSTPVMWRKDINEKFSPEIADILIEWMRENSWKYRTPAPQFRSKKWEELVILSGGNVNSSIERQMRYVQSNLKEDPKVRWYNYIQNKLKEYQPQVVYSHRINNRLPSVIKSKDERLKEGQTAAEVSRFAIHSAFNFLPDDTERGEDLEDRTITNEKDEEVQFLPIYYSKNLKAIYESRYNNLKPEVRSSFIESVREQLENEYSKLKAKDKTSKKDFIRKGAKKLYVKQNIAKNQSYDIADIYFKYFNNIIDFSEKSKILPEMELARFLVNNRKVIQKNAKGLPIIDAIKDKVLTKEGANSMVASQLNDWMDAIYYGKKDISNKRLSKITDLLNKYTAFNMLGLNFVQGVNNVTLGSIQQWVEAAGGEHYTKKNYLKAKKIYSKNLLGILDDVGERRPKNLINILNERFDTLNDYFNPDFKKNTKFRQMLTSNSMMFASHAGEHLMQSKVLLAMLDNIEAKDAQGNSLGSVLDNTRVKDGNIVFETADGVKVDNFNEKDQDIFAGKVKRVLSSIHGEYSELGRVAIQRYALGRMAYMFRKFIVPGIKRRYGKRNYNNLSDTYTEGFYRTGGKFIISLFQNLMKAQTSLMSTNWKELSSNEKANIKRFITEAAFLLLASLVISILDSIGDDDDDDDSWILSFLTYQVVRLHTELSFFFNFNESQKILRSPAASLAMVENTGKLLGQLMDPVLDFTFKFERYERGNRKGEFKIRKTITDMVPGIKQYYRLIYIDDQITWLR